MTHLRLVLCGCVLACLPASGGAQEEAPVTVPFQGSEAFSHILHSFNLKPLTRIGDAGSAPEKTLIVVFGDLQALDRIEAQLGSLTNFRAQSGAVLIASDYSSNRRSSLPFIAGAKLLAERQSAYQGRWPFCPVVRTWTDAEHPLFKGLTKGLATNLPSFLHGRPPDLRVLARFPPDCHFDFPRGFAPPPSTGYIAGSPKETGPGGRMLVIAGHGLFLNGMLLQRDNDNFTFAWNAVRWLTEGPTPRDQALFFEEGSLVEEFGLPLSRFDGFPVPPIHVINRMIRGLEEENIFNRLLLENVDKEAVKRGLLLAASAFLVILGGWRLMQGRFKLDTGVPIVVGKEQVVLQDASVLAMREKELRLRGNLWEPAQVLVRQFFLDHAEATLPLWENDTAPPPVVEVSGTFWQRHRLTRKAHELWRLALSSPAHPVPPRRFNKLLKVLAELDQAIADGSLRFKSRIQ